MASQKNYYDILGVPRTATEEEIKKAFRRLARQFHPDVNNDKGAEARFKEINEAYETLGDEQKRATYDRLNPQPREGAAAQRGAPRRESPTTAGARRSGGFWGKVAGAAVEFLEEMARQAEAVQRQKTPLPDLEIAEVDVALLACLRSRYQEQSWVVLEGTWIVRHNGKPVYTITRDKYGTTAISIENKELKKYDQNGAITAYLSNLNEHARFLAIGVNPFTEYGSESSRFIQEVNKMPNGIARAVGCEISRISPQSLPARLDVMPHIPEGSPSMFSKMFRR